MKEFVEKARKELPQDTELQNIIDEIADLINTTLYKLRFLN
jgi:Tfp pilus assembly protein PilO